MSNNRLILNLPRFPKLILTPFIVCDGQRLQTTNCVINQKENNIHVSCKYPNDCQEDFYLIKYEQHYCCKRYFKNGENEIKLNELGLEIKDISFGADATKDYFYHAENPRIYEKMCIPVDYDRCNPEASKDSGFDAVAGNRWADPGVVHERIGRSPYQPFPAILLSNYDSRLGLVHGTLSQKVFYHSYLVAHQSEKLIFTAYSGFKAIDALQCQSGKILVDEWYLGQCEQADDLEKIFEPYAAVLRKHLPPLYGASNINRHSMVWGSWNDGILRNISDEMILKEAAYLKENFPMVTWIQLDDGYAVHTPPAHGLGMPYEGEAGLDQKKFPAGLRNYADRIKELGLRPAIWIGGFCPKHTPIYKDHPEWFINYDYRVPASAPLDVSQPEVQQYIEKALDYFFKECAFDGMKHDFWSYAFEDSHDLLKFKTASGYEWRRWWLQEIRKRLPDNGYLQTGCDIVMGNPFLAEYFTNYRYGIDIGSGNWDYVKTNFLWGVACFATHTGDLFVPNSDSVGLFPGLDDCDAMFCLNYCLITRSMVEIAGKLSETDPEHPRLKNLRKATCCPNNGQEVFFARYDYRDKQQKVPQIIFLKTPHFSCQEAVPSLPLRTLALFNLEDEEAIVKFNAQDLGLEKDEYLLTDVWSGNTVLLQGECSMKLEAHGSRLLTISKNKEKQILDANLKIEAGNGQDLYLPWGGKAEFILSSELKKLVCNGKAADFTCKKQEHNYCLKFTAAANTSLQLLWR
ncbi:MAG: hypothetical protein GX946_07605 [Oligosphaeraceae bacterium]|nr:hypothetical protein [Oligosphaeraceae bacterium]